MGKKFRFQGLELFIHDDVYEPAEDSFQLLDAIDVKAGESVLELGCGCGILGLMCAKKQANVICSDINPAAVNCSLINYEMNKDLIEGLFEVRLGDLFSVLKSDETFDLIIFNPPYLPTKKEDLVGGSGWFDVATDGGTDGLKIIKKFLESYKKYLKDKGRAYFIFSSQSNKTKFEKYLNDRSINYIVINSIDYSNEALYVYKVLKN